MKRMVSFLLALCMILAPTYSVLAGSDESAALEKAILIVKNVVTVPANYTDFSHNSYTGEAGEESGTVWNLDWRDPKSSDSLSAAVDWKGNIINFYRYKENTEDKGLAKVSRSNAKLKAEQFLKKACPALSANMRQINEKANLNYTYEHYFQYCYYLGEKPVPFISVNLGVNKYTGEVTSFGGLSTGFTFPVLPDTKDVIGKEKAVAAYAEKLGFRLAYHSYYDYEARKLNVFPVYEFENTTKFIDALTGEVVEYYYGSPIYYGGSSEMRKELAVGDENGSMLSEEEVAELVKLRSLLSQSEAVSKIREQVPNTTGLTFTVENANLSQQYMDPEEYIWYLGFKDFYASVNAKSGELLSYSFYGESPSGFQNNSQEKCRELGEAYLKRVASEKLSQCEYSEQSNAVILYSTEELPDSYSFWYERKVNGMPYTQNGISVTVERKTGRITYYNCEWYGNATFPMVKGEISEAKLFEIVDKQAGYDLMYQQVGETGEVRLVYGFINAIDSYIFDPVTGGGLDWEGKPYKPVVRPEYKDIKGHFCETAASILLENGYFLEGDLFKPNEKITQAKFFRYLYSATYSYFDQEELYEMLENADIIKKSEMAPDSLLTRQDASKFIVRYLGLGLAGEHPEMFKISFKDKVTEGYKGYAALVNGLGIMKGDKTGKFNGVNSLTNGEAAVVIYKALEVK